MTEFNFFLSAADTDRLYTCKHLAGLDNLTGNQYAQQLLEAALWKMFPATPHFDDDGELTNPEKYKGGNF
jgi:hypothetical protein